jgi:hypothetical protein
MQQSELLQISATDTALQRSEKFRAHWERRSKRLYKLAHQALIAADAGDSETAANILFDALNPNN